MPLSLSEIPIEQLEAEIVRRQRIDAVKERKDTLVRERTYADCELCEENRLCVRVESRTTYNAVHLCKACLELMLEAIDAPIPEETPEEGPNANE